MIKGTTLNRMNAMLLLSQVSVMGTNPCVFNMLDILNDFFSIINH